MTKDKTEQAVSALQDLRDALAHIPDTNAPITEIILLLIDSIGGTDEEDDCCHGCGGHYWCKCDE